MNSTSWLLGLLSLAIDNNIGLTQLTIIKPFRAEHSHFFTAQVCARKPIKKKENPYKQQKQTERKKKLTHTHSPCRDRDQTAEHTVVRGGDVDVAEAEVGDDDGSDARNASSKRRVHPKKRRERGKKMSRRCPDLFFISLFIFCRHLSPPTSLERVGLHTVNSLWSSGDIRGASPGLLVVYGYCDEFILTLLLAAEIIAQKQ